MFYGITGYTEVTLPEGTETNYVDVTIAEATSDKIGIPEFLKPYANGGIELKNNIEINGDYDYEFRSLEKYNVVFNTESGQHEYSNVSSLSISSYGDLLIDNNVRGVLFTAASSWFAEYKDGKLYISQIVREVSTSVNNGIYTKFNPTAGTAGNIAQYDYYRFVDGSIGLPWKILNNNYPSEMPGYESYIEFYSDKAFVPTGYILTTSADSFSYNGCSPAGWTIKGKLLESDAWTVLAKVENDNVIEDINLKSYEYNIKNNTAPYKYFRFEFTHTKGSTYFQLSEFQFKGEAVFYDITIDENISKGKVKAEKNKYHAGDTVKLEVTPDTEYQVKSVSVNDGDVVVSDNNDGTYSFVMPDRNVTVSAEFAIPVNLDENGTELTTTNYTVLTGNEPINNFGKIELQSGTYVVDKNVSYANQLMLKGDTTLILKDGAKLSIDTRFKYDNCIYSMENEEDLFCVCGQRLGTGELVLDTNNVYSSISCNNYKQCGGKVTATSENGHAVYALNNLMIYGGELTAESKNYSGIYNDYGSIYFNGGKVSAKTGARYIGAINNSGYVKTYLNGGEVEAITMNTASNAVAMFSKCDIYFNGGTLTSNGSMITYGNQYLNGGIVKSKRYCKSQIIVTGTYSSGTKLYTGEYTYEDYPYTDWWDELLREIDGKMLAPAYSFEIPEKMEFCEGSEIVEGMAQKSAMVKFKATDGFTASNVSDIYCYG